MTVTVGDLPGNWQNFLREFDSALDRQVRLVCIGGFVFKFIYGHSRETQDLDFCHCEPRPYGGFSHEAGKRSDLHRKHKVFLHSATFDIPIGYQSRLTEIFPNEFKYLRLCMPDAYDLILSKLVRGSGKDRADVAFLFKQEGLDTAILNRRYNTELRPFLTDQAAADVTLEVWTTLFQDSSNQAS